MTTWTQLPRKRTAEYVFTGRACRRGHVGPRYKNGNCVQCLLDREKARQSDPAFAEAKRRAESERAKQKCADQAAQQAEERARRKTVRAERARARRDETAKAYREAHRDRLRIANRETSRLHFQANKARYAARNARRRAAKAQAVPTWADLEAIRAIYEAAASLSLATGVAMSVDHIVPLRGLHRGEHIVCGLHCEVNLQIIPLTENKMKNAYIWPGQPA